MQVTFAREENPFIFPLQFSYDCFCSFPSSFTSSDNYLTEKIKLGPLIRTETPPRTDESDRCDSRKNLFFAMVILVLI